MWGFGTRVHRIGVRPNHREPIDDGAAQEPREDSAEDIGGPVNAPVDAAQAHQSRPNQRVAPDPCLVGAPGEEQQHERQRKRRGGVSAWEAVMEESLLRIGVVEHAGALPLGDHALDSLGEEDAGNRGGQEQGPHRERGVPPNRSDRIDKRASAQFVPKVDDERDQQDENRLYPTQPRAGDEPHHGVEPVAMQVHVNRAEDRLVPYPERIHGRSLLGFEILVGEWLAEAVVDANDVTSLPD